MALEVSAIQRVRIYLSERDTFDKQALYLAVLDRLRQEGAIGASALRGVAGFGSDQHRRMAGTAGLSQSLPIIIEWVDRAEHIATILPLIEPMVPDALITLEDVRIYRAINTSTGPFGDQSISDVLITDVVTATATTSVQQAITLLLDHNQAILPILDSNKHVIGVFSSNDFKQRSQPPCSLTQFVNFPATEQQTILSQFEHQPITALINPEPRTIYVAASILQAIQTMLEWGADALPVIDREGHLVGIFGVEQALQASVNSGTGQHNSTPINLVMQSSVPQVSASAPLSNALAQLLISPQGFLVVVDQLQPIGILHKETICSQLSEPLRSAWIAQLSIGSYVTDPAIVFPSDQLAADLASPVPTISLSSTERDATEQMLKTGHEQIIVTDDQGRVAGLLQRKGILRSLAQESVA